MSEEEIFHDALARDPADRPAYLDRACAGDPALRASVEALLRANVGATAFLAAAPATARPPAEAAGTVIGPYKLVEQVGEGGMGTVWMAQQTEPVRRVVALKVIKPGMDSRQVIARFEAERQALALMDHPNIAKVFDAGTSGGRPFFVMELVRGVPITQFCDERRLTPRERLGVFVQVCSAVQHAHQKGVIHRDLKPSNVLVAEYDPGAPGVPKVIDFGVAKATGQPLTDKTLLTGFGALVGTPEYMSPEQAEVNQLDIDTRSDIYSLGVLLYELLAGSPPFSRKELEKAGMLEMLRVIREQEPSRPSTKLSTADGLPTLAANRGTEPAKLTKLVRGELDWIVMKALEKDRNRRYETANGLAMDVRRYLADEPVQARPHSAGYHLRKFVRRNRRWVLAGGVLALAVVAVVGSVGWAIGDRMERQAAADRGALDALNEAHVALDTGRRAAARTALDRADSYLVAAGDGHAAAWAVGLRRDLTLLDRLDAVRVQSLERSASDIKQLDYGRAESEYSEAFRAAGLDLDGTDAGGAAEQFAGRVGMAELAGALDDWAVARTALKHESGAKHLRAVARQIDPDRWRNRVRDAVDRRDVAALKALAGSPELEGQSAGAIHCLAKALVEAGASSEAAAILTAAQPRHAGDFWVNYTLGHALSTRSGRDSTPYFMAAAALRPNDDAAAFRVGFLLGRQKDPAARAWLDLVAQHHPTSASMHQMRAQSLNDLGDRPAAIEAWKQALRLQPDDQNSRISLAQALVQAGAYEEAVQTLDDYSRRIPPGAAHEQLALNNTTRLLLRLADLLTTGPDPDVLKARLAVRAAARAVELSPNNGIAHALLGMAQYRAGDYSAAVEVLSRPMARAQRPHEIAFFGVMARAKLGKSSDSRKEFAAAVLSAEIGRASDAKVRRLAAEAAGVVAAPLPASFRDGPAAPVSPPTPVAPPNWSLLDRTLVDSKQERWRATLTWDPVEKATRYHLQARTLTFPFGESNLANPVVPFAGSDVDNSQVRGLTFTYSSRLGFRRPGEFFPMVCRWRVRALVDDAWTAWSPEQTFWVIPPTIGAPKLND